MYISSLSSNRLIEKIKEETGEDPGYAVQKFNRYVVMGLKMNGAFVNIYSKPPINRIVGHKWVSLHSEIENGLTYNYVRYFNIPLLKDICVCVGAFWEVLKFGVSNRKDKAVVCDVLAISMNIGAVLAARLLGVKIVGLVTDMPGMMVELSANSRMPFLRRIISTINLSYITSYTHYIFLTEQMNHVINKHGRPYIVMEALCDSSDSLNMMIPNQVVKADPKIVMYAGGLNEKYGLKILINGFRRIEREDIKLVIFGSGPYVDELLQAVKEDSRIEYRGVVSNEKVVQAESEATLLVNPRPTTEEFAKYSFPSKNMEYMASGTPLLTTKLPGMPVDYYPYVYLFEEESVEGYSVALNEVLGFPSEELRLKGDRAKQYVLENKNYVLQASRILKLIMQ